MNIISDGGYTAGEGIRASAAIAMSAARSAALALIAVDNANQAIKNFKKQWKIAKRGLAIAQEQQAHLETVFWPRELSFLNEFAATPPHDGVEVVETVEALGRRYAGRLVSKVAGDFAKTLAKLRTSMGRYTTSQNVQVLQELLAARGMAIATARVMGRNIAWAELEARKTVDWSRRMQAIALGKGLSTEATALLASAGSLYGKSGVQQANTFAQTLQGASREIQGLLARQHDRQAMIDQAKSLSGYKDPIGAKSTEGAMTDMKVSSDMNYNPSSPDIMKGALDNGAPMSKWSMDEAQVNTATIGN